MRKKFRNTSLESGQLIVQVAQSKLSFYVESGAEFYVETDENADIQFSSPDADTPLIIEPV
jgi:hypothetical protein|tara:strand:- start:46 stop:228 length:183 start_codon:yes stop_codon:yes gene_type:complete